MNTNLTRLHPVCSASCFALLLFGSLVPQKAAAQAGAWDYGFSADGYVNVDIAPFEDRVNSLAVQQDGKLVIVGSVEEEFSEGSMMVARFNVDGSLDATFNGDGIGLFPELGSGYDVAVLPDGKLLVLADGDVLFRLTSAGYPDSDFDLDGQVEFGFPDHEYGSAYYINLYADGRILVGGRAGDPGQVYFAAARFNADGSLDNSFSMDGTTSVLAGDDYSSVDGMALLPDGSVVLIGTQHIDEPDNTDFLRMVRLTASGELDANFGLNGIVDDPLGMSGANLEFFPASVHALSDGSMIVTGQRGYPYYDGVVVKYLANGTRDLSFSFDGMALTAPSISDALIQPDGKILTCAYAGFLRLLPTGNLDPSFGTNGVVSVESEALYQIPLEHIALAPDGKIHTAGYGFVLEGDDYRSILVARFLNDLNIGIAEFTTTGNTLVYPNPISDQATFGYTLLGAEKITCALHDAEGRVVRTYLGGIHRSVGTHSETLDLRGLAAGRYTIVLSNTSGSTANSIIKN